MKVAQSCLTLCDHMDHTIQSMESLQSKIPGWVPFPFSRDLPNPGIKPRSLALQADYLPTELWGKPAYNLLTYVKTLQWYTWEVATQVFSWSARCAFFFLPSQSKHIYWYWYAVKTWFLHKISLRIILLLTRCLWVQTWGWFIFSSF